MNLKKAREKACNHEGPEKHFKLDKSAVAISWVVILGLGKKAPPIETSAFKQNDFLHLIPSGFL